MIIKVIGKERITGTFNNNPYDNTMVYCVEEFGTRNPHEGHKAHCLKVKAKVMSYDNIQLAEHYEVYYDEYRNVARLEHLVRKE